MAIDYDHSRNLHSLEGPKRALPALINKIGPSSILDVGCGTGTWIRAAMDTGVTDVAGVDGVAQTEESLVCPIHCFRQQDLTLPWNLGRKFDLALCLEVAEHIDAQYADVFLDNLVAHADTIFFSAACPNQIGQHHVNCQWPAYWQRMFNIRGYTCDDWPRWAIWDDRQIEPWYRQNIFMATKSIGPNAQEPQIHSVIHPDMLSLVRLHAACSPSFVIEDLEAGSQPVSWYFSTLATALWAKLCRLISKIPQRFDTSA